MHTTSGSLRERPNAREAGVAHVSLVEFRNAFLECEE
jgi:hypothetical protein